MAKRIIITENQYQSLLGEAEIDIDEILRKSKENTRGSNVEMVSVADLKPFVGEDRNLKPVMAGPHNRSEENLKTLIPSIIENGIQEEIVIIYDKYTGEASVVEGNHRYEAAFRIGMSHIPARVEVYKLRSDEKSAYEDMYPLQKVQLNLDRYPRKPSDLGLKAYPTI